MRISREAMLPIVAAFMAIALGCAGSKVDARPAPIASSSPIDKQDAAPPPIAASALRPVDPRQAFDAKVIEAFASLSAKGLTPEVVEQFRALPKITTAKPRPATVTALEGSLSDDGLALVVKTLGSGQVYFADPKTGGLRARRAARWHEGPPRVLSGTHFVALSEERTTTAPKDPSTPPAPAPLASSSSSSSSSPPPPPRREPLLGIYDAVTGATQLEVPGATAVCSSAAGSLVAWAGRDGAKFVVHAWDAKTKSEIDTFDSPAMPQWDGCVRVLTTPGSKPPASTPSSSIVAVSWAGYNLPRGLMLRDVVKKQTLTTLTGGSYGPELRPSPDGKLLAIGQRPDQRGALAGGSGGAAGQTLLVDIATGKTVATSAECPSPGSLVFDAKGTMLAAGDQREVCLFAVPSLKLIRKTAPMRDPFPPGNVTQVIRELRFYAQGTKEPALLGATEDGKAVAYKVSNGAVLWKGERGGFMVDMDSAGKEGVAHFLIRKSDDGPFAHITMGQDLKIKEEAPQESEMKQLYERRWEAEKSEALRSALGRVASSSCELAGVLVPKETCEP